MGAKSCGQVVVLNQGGGTSEPLVVEDTPTVNLEGDGTTTTPLTAAVIPSADANNALTVGSDGGVFVPEFPPDVSGFNFASGTLLNLQPSPGNTWVPTTLTVNLPEAGTYLLDATVRGLVAKPSGVEAYILGRLFNVTTGTDVPGSETLAVHQSLPDTVVAQSIGPISTRYTVAGPTTIRVEGLRSPSTTTATLESDIFGRTTVRFFKVSG